MRRPNFLFIGPDKTGSSWLYEVLREHPNCFVPVVKDIYFFDRYYDRGLDWYLRFFDEAPEGATAIGELSHDYLFSPLAAERIRRDLPAVKLLTCLRDPVRRTFSHYLYLVRNGVTADTFEQALEKFPELIANSSYATHLSRYFAVFGRQEIRVLLYERLASDPRGFASEVFEYLGVAFAEVPALYKRVLPASRPRSGILARAAKAGANLARDLNLAWVVGIVKRGPVTRLLYQDYRDADRPRLRPETEARLRALFADQVTELEGLLGRRLPEWRTGKD